MKKSLNLLLVLILSITLLGSIKVSYATETAQYIPGGKNYIDGNNFTYNSNAFQSIDNIKVEGVGIYTLSMPYFMSEQGQPIITIVGSINGSYANSVGMTNESNSFWTYTFTTTGSPDETISIQVTGSDIGGYIGAMGYQDIQLELGATRTSFEWYVAPLTDSTPPLINGATGVYLINVDNPDSVADLKTTLTATDNIDGNLTSSITVSRDLYTGNENTLGDYEVDFTVSDSASNTTTITVTFRVLDLVDPIINLIGGSTINLEYGTPWIEPGFTATDNYDGSITVTVTGTVNDSVLGTYIINYNATDNSSNYATEKTRTVNVVDSIAPQLSLTGASIIYIEFGQNYTEQGAMWTDAYDGSGSAIITGSVNVGVIGSYTLYYNITDTNGNVATQITRTVVVRDTTAPVFNGDTSYTFSTSVYITLDQILEDITVLDIYDGNLTSSIIVSSNNFNDQGGVVGIYTVVLSATDSTGNVKTMNLSITIEDNEAPIFFTSANILTHEFADTMTQQDYKDYFNNQ